MNYKLYVELLKEIPKNASEGFSLENHLEFIWMKFKNVIPYNRIGFARLDEDGVVHSIFARSDTGDTPQLTNVSFHIGETSLMSVVLSRKPRIINDFEQYSKEHPSSKSVQKLLKDGIQSNLTCPLMTKSQVVGFMFFSSFEKETYQVRDVESFTFISNQMTILLEMNVLLESLKKERDRSLSLLHNSFPLKFVPELLKGKAPETECYPTTSVMFLDIVGFTEKVGSSDPKTVIALLNDIFYICEKISQKNGVEKIKTIGDSILLCAGAPIPCPNHADVLLKTANEILLALKHYNKLNKVESVPKAFDELDFRIGINSGGVNGGIIGTVRTAFDIFGDTVNVASRMESNSEPGHIQISEATYELVKDSTDCTFGKRSIKVKGKGDMTTFLVFPGDKTLPDDLELLVKGIVSGRADIRRLSGMAISEDEEV